MAGTTPQFRMLEELLDSLGARKDALCSNPALTASVFTDGENTSVFLLNLYTGELSSHVTVYDVNDASGKNPPILEDDVTLAPMEVRYIKIK